MIKFYSKENCPSCEYFGSIGLKRFDSSRFQIVKFEDDTELVAVMKRFGVTSVPFITLNDNSVIKGDDVKDFVFRLRSI